MDALSVPRKNNRHLANRPQPGCRSKNTRAPTNAEIIIVAAVPERLWFLPYGSPVGVLSEGMEAGARRAVCPENGESDAFGKTVQCPRPKHE